MEQEMRYVYTVYEQKSFSRAAKTLYMTQPALSIAIQKVENRIGTPLFDRTSKPIKLTAAGELYIQNIKAIQELEDGLQQKINDLSDLKTGILRIGGTHYFNSYVLPPVIASFVKKYPGIHIDLIEDSSQNLLQMLYDHSIDITFNCTQKPKDSFRRIPSFIDSILLAIPENYSINKSLHDYAFTASDILQKKHQEFITPDVPIKSLSDIPFILLSTGNDLQRRCLSFFEDANIHPTICMEVSQLVTAWHLACAGIGATFISDLLVTSDTKNMLFYRISSPMAIRVFDITMSDRHYISNAMQAFQETFCKHYGLNVPVRKLK